MSVPHLRDERLAWLAIEDRARARARRSPMAALTSLLGGGGGRMMGMGFGGGSGGAGATYVQRDAQGYRNRRLMRFEIAADRLANRLSQQEREVLRSTGKVPDWFFGAVVAEARKVKLR